MAIPHPYSPHLAWGAAGFAVANAGAAYISFAANAYDASAIVGGITVVCGALVMGLKSLAPIIAEAIRTIGPALTELRRQREEFEKGSLSRQNRELSEKLSTISEQLEKSNSHNKELNDQIIIMSSRVEDANQKLHDSRNRANAETLKRQDEAQILKRDLESARAEIANLRHESLDKTRAIEQRTEQMGFAVRANTADIRTAADNIAILSRDSGSFPAVPSDDGTGVASDKRGGTGGDAGRT